MHEFQKRIRFKGDIKPLLIRVCRDYQLGGCISYRVVPVGYEDFNLMVKTHGGKYFVKLFASYRGRENCIRYINIIRRVIFAGVYHPKLYKVSQGFLYETTLDKVAVRLCVMEWIEGESLYDKQSKVTKNETKFLIRQAALINQIRLKPSFVYDSWAICNFLKEYKKKKQFLSKSDNSVISRLSLEFAKLQLKKLPHALVHGDILKTNVLKDKRGRIFIIDFSVANNYPRIQELAVLLCSVLFDEKHSRRMIWERVGALREYQKYIKLSDYEVKSFSLYCDVAHAMHVLQATFERKMNKNFSKENTYWLKLGRIGLGLA
ncbi:MAG: scyllo-inosamine-4-phosphate amidinotransferase [Parcubacteria group bacterium GW2011_GWB1_52_7]|nr:MAG: scyllo-inosamine-4-phosphate amidinotransferase [Parcubacteria group bacterium GW2011_GWB1_52_7]